MLPQRGTPTVLRIDHVGSTAVPGLAAKDVIDIQVVVADQSDLDSYRPAIESTGIGLRYREPERTVFPTETLRGDEAWATATGWRVPPVPRP